MEHDALRAEVEEEHYGRQAFHRQKTGAGRVFAYFLVMAVINVLLAVYALYMLGFALAFDWTMLSSATVQAILESAMQLLLLFSPVILTIILNRLIYRVFRGRRRFPRGTWFFAILTVAVIQVATVVVINAYGYVDGANGFHIEQLTTQTVD